MIAICAMLAGGLCPKDRFKAEVSECLTPHVERLVEEVEAMPRPAHLSETEFAELRERAVSVASGMGSDMTEILWAAYAHDSDSVTAWTVLFIDRQYKDSTVAQQKFYEGVLACAAQIDG